MNKLPLTVRLRGLWRSTLHWSAHTNTKLWRFVLRLEFLGFAVASVAAYGSIAVIEQMRLERRGWLNLKQPQFKEPLKPDALNAYEMNVENTGRTPGTIVSAHMKFVLADSLDQVERFYDDLALVSVWGGVVPPGGWIRYEGEHTFSKAEVEIIQARKATLYLIGEWRYRDGLTNWFSGANVRTTRYCMTYEPRAPFQDNLRFCPKFNEMN